MRSAFFVEIVPCSRCGQTPGWGYLEPVGKPRQIVISCSAYRCGGEQGPVGMDYPDPETMAPLARLRLVRAGRWRTPEQSRVQPSATLERPPRPATGQRATGTPGRPTGRRHGPPVTFKGTRADVWPGKPGGGRWRTLPHAPKVPIEGRFSALSTAGGRKGTRAADRGAPMPLAALRPP